MDLLVSLAEWLSPERLLEDPRSVEGGAYLSVAVALALIGILGALLSTRAQLLSRGNTLHEGLMRTYGTWLVWLAVFGLLATVVRYANAPFFSKRIWLALDLMAILGLAAYFVIYRLTTYRRDLERYHENLRAQRFRLASHPRPRRSRSGHRRR
ncbi:MAG: hypothetical protein HY534_07490 [Chloroflexi bacterium]|nr:hypothetical protein [Chloroflexota bacterium]